MTKILAPLFVLFAGALAYSAMAPSAVAHSAAPVQTVPAQPASGSAMPAPQEPLDTTEITPVESAGAARGD